MGCCASGDYQSQPKSQIETPSISTIFGKMYRVKFPNCNSFIGTFIIDNHEYIGCYDGSNASLTHFIHSPNCKCHNELCTSSDCLSQPSWY